MFPVCGAGVQVTFTSYGLLRLLLYLSIHSSICPSINHRLFWCIFLVYRHLNNALTSVSPFCLYLLSSYLHDYVTGTR